MGRHQPQNSHGPTWEFTPPSAANWQSLRQPTFSSKTSAEHFSHSSTTLAMGSCNTNVMRQLLSTHEPRLPQSRLGAITGRKPPKCPGFYFSPGEYDLAWLYRRNRRTPKIFSLVTKNGCNKRPANRLRSLRGPAHPRYSLAANSPFESRKNETRPTRRPEVRQQNRTVNSQATYLVRAPPPTPAVGKKYLLNKGIVICPRLFTGGRAIHGQSPPRPFHSGPVTRQTRRKAIIDDRRLANPLLFKI